LKTMSEALEVIKMILTGTGVETVILNRKAEDTSGYSVRVLQPLQDDDIKGIVILAQEKDLRVTVDQFVTLQ